MRMPGTTKSAQGTRRPADQPSSRHGAANGIDGWPATAHPGPRIFGQAQPAAPGIGAAADTTGPGPTKTT